MNESEHRRLERKAERLERRLGLTPGADPSPASVNEIQANQMRATTPSRRIATDADRRGWRINGKRLNITEQQLAAAGMLEIDDEDDEN